MTDQEYVHRAYRDPSTKLFTYEYLSESGLYRIQDMNDIELLNLCDELDAAGDNWEPVLHRWALGYRDSQP
jgi:hypothetical protein